MEVLVNGVVGWIGALFAIIMIVSSNLAMTTLLTWGKVLALHVVDVRCVSSNVLANSKRLWIPRWSRLGWCNFFFRDRLD